MICENLIVGDNTTQKKMVFQPWYIFRTLAIRVLHMLKKKKKLGEREEKEKTSDLTKNLTLYPLKS
jgi:hypothetical protein